VDIYGEGDLRNELQQQIDENKVNVHLKGRYDISSKLYNDYDLFIMTSKIEGMPVALIEALTSGMPSLLPDHLPVMKELAEDSAWYFNSIEELAQLLENINKKELVFSSLRAKALSEKYSLRSYVNSLRNLYSEKFSN
jgi:glycosyltransferase involved in cell wall biosynthesis